MTKEEKLLHAIGEIDDELILAAEDFPHNVLPLSRKKQWKKIAMTAACFLLIAGVWFSVDDLFRMGSSKPAAPEAAPQAPAATDVTTETNLELLDDNFSTTEPEEAPAETPEMPAELTAGAPIENAPMEEQKQQPVEANPTTGGVGENNPAVGGPGRSDAEYLQYYLPVQPLQVSGESSTLFVEREMTVDASDIPFVLDTEKLEPIDHYFTNMNIGKNTVNISDSYTMRNNSNESVSVDLKYLYGESLDYQNDVTMKVDGSAEGQNRTVGSAHSTSAIWPEVDNYESFSDFAGRVYNLPCIMFSETAKVYRFHHVDAGNAPENRSAIYLNFDVPKGIPVYFENVDGVRSDEGEYLHYEVSGGLRLKEWTVLICGDVETKFDVSFIQRKDGEKVYLKADYELDEDTVNLRSYMTQKTKEYLEEHPLMQQVLTAEEMVNAVFEIMYRPEKLYKILGENTNSYQNMIDLFIDALGGYRYLSLNQTVTIPANGSVTVEIQLKKPLNEFYEDSALGLELLNDGMMPTTVKFIPPKAGATVESSIPSNGTLDPGMDCYHITMKQEICDGVPLKQ